MSKIGWTTLNRAKNTLIQDSRAYLRVWSVWYFRNGITIHSLQWSLDTPSAVFEETYEGWSMLAGMIEDLEKVLHLFIFLQSAMQIMTLP